MITKDRLESEKKEAYIRGYLAAMEMCNTKLKEICDSEEAELLNDSFRDFCDSHKKCESCECYSDGVDDCMEYFKTRLKK